MERWNGKVAVVTGASAGIGAAMVVDLIKSGLIVVGLARRSERVEALKKKIPSHLSGKLHAVKCDVSNEDDIKNAFAWIENKLGGVDILVNNAGIIRATQLINADNSDFIRDTVETNILGVVWCTRAAFQSMKKRNVDGHVVLINSTAGHKVFYTKGTPMGSFNIYSPSKYAVTAMTEILRQEFQAENTKIKVTVKNRHMIY